ncbi:MAG TPA: hypothetical protein VEC14_07820 [Reyranellaceae bacterium]|nr:hypothetical protein [Reyranellaceae bacterium]
MSEQSMIERVALAVFPILSRWAYAPPDKGRKTTQDVAAEVARAAIEAMREPTKEMRDAGAASGIGLFHLDRDGERTVYEAMISAALQETHDTQPGAE